MKTMTMDALFNELKTGLKPNEMILDVREADEFREGHIPGSKNYPLSTLESRLEEVKQYSAVFIHCRSGGRAQRAAAFLKSKGLQNLVCVSDGGFSDWVSAGYPIKK